ncbi:ROK family protein [Streptomyces sp. NPDC058745]|uniref:ROK family protein n=1 Tax=Streptomyces sp. NPDC058745 TaxID=3346621 RepID=UPI003690E782
MTHGVLAIDIGGTSTTTAYIGPDHEVHARRSAATPATDGAEAVLTTAMRLLSRTHSQAVDEGHADPVSLGIGTAGVVDPAGRTITHATSALAGWAGTPLAERAEQHTGLPTTVLGDVQAFLRGETAPPGAAAGCASAIGVMAGTGIGGAVFADGAVLRGAHGAAGHIGHIAVPQAAGLTCPCGAPDHVEAIASGPAMTAALAAERPGTPVTTLRDVAALAHAGDHRAQEILSRGGEALGTALAGLVSTIDPDCVVIAGGVMHSGPWYLRGLKKALIRHSLPALAHVDVHPSQLGADAVLIGAATAARCIPGPA